MTNSRILTPSIADRHVVSTHVVRRSVPAVSLALLALFATSGCGSDADAASDTAESTAEDVAAAAGDSGEAPEACSLLTLDEIKTATGQDYSAGEGTDYDNTCTFDTDSDRIKVAVSDWDDLESAEAIGIDVVPVDGLPGATRVDAMVYVEKDGRHLTVSTGLPGFAAPERDAVAAEELAKIAAARL